MHGRGSGGCSGVRLALQQMRERDERAQGCHPAAAKWKVRIQVGRLVTVTALDGCREGPAQIAIRSQRQQKGANELAVGEPDGISRLALVE